MADQLIFSMERMSKLFQKCAKSKKVNMDLYLGAWDELIRFLKLMGPKFGIVSSDLVEKVGILGEFRRSFEKEKYSTIEKMILFEKENGRINYVDAPSNSVKASGCRTVLRLHRALKFFSILLGKLARYEDDGKVSNMGYNAYHASPMSENHSGFTRKAIELALYFLPDRETFLDGMGHNMPEYELTQHMEVCSDMMDSVFEYTQALYSDYDILKIP